VLRDVVANPFLPKISTGDTTWLTPDVIKYARLIYQQGTFDCMPVFADYIEERGCTDERILRTEKALFT
jgi:hypothetical protein